MDIASNYIYDSIFKQCLSIGIKASIATNAATIGVDKFRKGRFKKASKLVDECVKDAKAGRV